MKDRKLLQEICKEDGCPKDSCFLREMMLHNGLKDKMVMQLKLVDKFKYDWSVESGHDIGYEEAFNKWVEIGYAKKYTDNWNAGEYTHHVTAMYHALKR